MSYNDEFHIPSVYLKPLPKRYYEREKRKFKAKQRYELVKADYGVKEDIEAPKIYPHFETKLYPADKLPPPKRGSTSCFFTAYSLPIYQDDDEDKEYPVVVENSTTINTSSLSHFLKPSVLEYEYNDDNQHELSQRQKEYFDRMSQPKEVPQPEPLPYPFKPNVNSNYVSQRKKEDNRNNNYQQQQQRPLSAMNPSTDTNATSPSSNSKRRPKTAKPSSSSSSLQLYSNMLSGNDYRTNTSGEYNGEEQYINQSMNYDIKPKKKQSQSSSKPKATRSKPKLQIMIEELKKTQEKEKEIQIHQLSGWLKQYHLLEYLESLIEIGYDSIDSLKTITVDDLQYINMKIGHQRLLFKALGRNVNKITINNNNNNNNNSPINQKHKDNINNNVNNNNNVCIEQSSVLIDSFESECYNNNNNNNNFNRNSIGKYEIKEDKVEDSQLLVVPSSPIVSPHKNNKKENVKEEEGEFREDDEFKEEKNKGDDDEEKDDNEEKEGEEEKEEEEEEEEVVLKPQIVNKSNPQQSSPPSLSQEYKIERISEQKSSRTVCNNYQISSPLPLKDIPIEVNINNEISEPEYYKNLPDVLSDFSQDRIYEESEAKNISIELLNDIEKLHLLCRNITFSTSCYLNGITVKEFSSIQNNINNESIEFVTDEFKKVELKHFYNRKLFLLQLVIKSMHNAYNVIEEKYMTELENNNELTVKISQIYNEEKIRKMKYRELDNRIEEYKHRRNKIWEARVKDYQKREIRRSQIYNKYLEGKMASQHLKAQINYEKLERRKRIDEETEKRGEKERKKLAQKLKERQEKADSILQAKASVYIQNGEENEKRRKEAYVRATEIYLNKIKKRADYILRKEEEYNSRIMSYNMNEKLKNYEKKLYEDDKIQENIRLQQVKDNKHRYMANKFEERGKKAEILNNVKQEFRSYSVL